MEKEFGNRVASNQLALSSIAGNHELNNINPMGPVQGVPQTYNYQGQPIGPSHGPSNSMPHLPVNSANQYLYHQQAPPPGAQAMSPGG